MNNSFDLYPTASIISNQVGNLNALWPVAGSSGGEIDLREEFYDFLYGSATEVPKGQVGLIRKARLTNGRVTVCSCVDENTHEPDIDHFCPYCHGLGYLWDEHLVTYYKTELSTDQGFASKDVFQQGGIVNIPLTFIYIEYYWNPNRFDKIVELARDAEGVLITPYTRTNIFTISTPQAFRSDNGRIEYWRLGSSLDAIRPVYEGV